MSDYISRQDAVERMVDVIINEFDVGITYAYTLAEDGLSLPPAADVVPVVHAYWMPQKENHEFKEAWIKCSKCGYPVSMWTGNTNFCPNCGAKMDGGKS